MIATTSQRSNVFLFEVVVPGVAVLPVRDRALAGIIRKKLCRKLGRMDITIRDRGKR